MSKIHLRFAAEAVNKDAGAPMTFVLEQVDPSGDDDTKVPYTSSFDVGDTDYGRGLKVYSRVTSMTDGTPQEIEAAFEAHLDLFERLNLKHAERLGRLRDDAKSGSLWRPTVAQVQQASPPPPPPPPPLTATPQTNPPGARQAATPPAAQSEVAAPPAGKNGTRRPQRLPS